jgi:nitroreductase
MTTQATTIKEAQTQFPVMDLIRERWSARSFSEQEIDSDTMNTILDGASWAPSANNEQPWQFFVAHKNTPAFDLVWQALMPGNQPWTQKAAALVVSIALTEFSANQKPNAYAEHDLGLANAFLILQARKLDVFTHIMAGFEKGKLSENLGLIPTQKPMTVLALGYLDEAEKLEEPFRTRELTPRNRKPLSDILL